MRTEGGRMGKSGFLRIVCAEGEGQKIELNRDEILRFAIKGNKVRFDEQYETAISAEKSLDNDKLRAFCRRKGLPEKTLPGDLLTNIGIAQKQQKHLLLTRAAVLFFCREPQRFSLIPSSLKFLPPLKLPVFHRKERNFVDGLFSMARHQCRILWELFTSPRQQSIGALQN